MTRTLALCLCFLSSLLIACTGDKSQEMLETAQFEERQHNQTHAKQLYEDIVRLYPQTPAAETARARLAQME